MRVLPLLPVLSSPVQATLSQLPWQQLRHLAIGAGLLTGIVTAALPAQANQPLENGDYLFGAVPRADVLGASYMVLRVQGDTLAGGFYQPSSSFDCFRGEVKGDQLQLTVVNSYDQSTHAYAVAFTAEPTDVASTTDVAGPLSLEGFHPIADMSSLDRRILATCTAI